MGSHDEEPVRQNKEMTNQERKSMIHRYQIGLYVGIVLISVIVFALTKLFINPIKDDFSHN